MDFLLVQFDFTMSHYKVAHYNEKWSSKKLRGFDMAYDELQELFLKKYS